MLDQVRPCYWMRGALNRIAENRPLGIFAWYVRAHLSNCKQCTKTLEALLYLRDKLAQGRPNGLTLSADKWAEIERLCAKTDSEKES